MRFADPAMPRCRVAAAGLRGTGPALRTGGGAWRRLCRALLALACVALGACTSLSGRVRDEPVGDQAGSAPAGASKAGAGAPPGAVRTGGAAAAGAPPGANAAAPPGPPVDPALAREFGVAVQAMQVGRMDEAEKGFIALTRSNPDLGGPHANLGIIYRRADKLAPAVAELELAVHCNPAQPAYWNQLGIAYRQQGQFAKAREAYEKAIRLDPRYAAANLNLGILFDLYLWDGNRALELYDRYLALTPAGDDQVRKWVADLKNRNRAAGNRKEQQ